MARIRSYLIITLAVIIFCFASGVYAAEVDDGFVSSREIKSRYFTILLASDVDLNQLTLNLFLNIF